VNPCRHGARLFLGASSARRDKDSGALAVNLSEVRIGEPAQILSRIILVVPTGHRPRATMMGGPRLACFLSLATLTGMSEERSLDLETLVKNAWQSTESLALEVMSYPPALRDEAMRRMGEAFTEAIQAAGASESVARQFGAQMEETVRALVSDIVASGSGSTGSA
jgi:hypothetical protein